MDITTISVGNVGIHTLTNNRKHHLSHVPTILPNGIDTQGRPIIAVDWSRSKVDVYDGKTNRVCHNLIEVAQEYPNTLIVLESTTESFELQNRQTVLDAFKKNNIKAYCFSPKHTARARMLLGIKKTDATDAAVIFHIFTKTTLTCSVLKQIVEKEKDKLRIVSQKALIKDRREDSEESLKMIERYIPNFTEVPVRLHEYLYQPTKSKKPRSRKPKIQVPRYLIVASMVRQAGYGFRTFRRLIGNYGNGFGCMARSEFYHHHVGSVCDAKVKAAGIQRTFVKGETDAKTGQQKNVPKWTPIEYKLHKEAMKGVSGIVKWLWRQTAKG